jgi:hypothetical protein
MKHLSLIIAIAAVGNCLAAESGEPLQLKQTITLSGVEGRIDHFAFDAAGQRLFVCALGNDTVEVLDVRKASGFTRLPAWVHRRESPTFLN